MDKSDTVIYQDDRKTGLIIVLAGILFMSFDPLLIRLAASDSWTTAFWFGGFIFLSMGLYLYAVEKTNYLAAIREGGLALAIYAACMGGSASSLILSVNLTLAANTIVILSATPLFAAILSRLFLKEAIALHTWVAIFFCICGLAIVFSSSLGHGQLLGDYFALQTTFFVACLHTIMRKHKNLSRAAAVGLGGLVVAMISSVSASPFALPLKSYLPLAVLGLITAPAGRILMSTGPRYLPAPEVGLISLLNAFLAPFWVWVLFSEAPNRTTVLGGVIILATLVLHTLYGRRFPLRRSLL